MPPKARISAAAGLMPGLAGGGPMVNLIARGLDLLFLMLSKHVSDQFAAAQGVEIVPRFSRLVKYSWSSCRSVEIAR